MKNVINVSILVLIIVVLYSCITNQPPKSDKKTYYTVEVCTKSHSENKWEYNYGYNILKQKWEYGYGLHLVTICDSYRTDTVWTNE